MAMGRMQRYGVVVLLCAAPAAIATAAGATKLQVPVASHRAASFAKRTCDHDASCVRSGVSNCRRQRARVVLCRVFLRRRTDVQGRYRCTRLVRLSLIPGTRHARVTGVGSWRC
jgi:hypothetical protein